MWTLARSPHALVLAVLAGAPAVACVNISAVDARYVDTSEKQFTVSGAPTVKLGTFDGSIDVTTWDRPEVRVVIEKHAADKAAADRMTVSATQDGDRIEVDVRQPASEGFNITIGPRTAHLKVSVPVRTTVEVGTGDGRVSVRGVQGDLVVRTGDGTIRLQEVDGSVEATSGDGSVEISGAIQRLVARSGDGRLMIRASGPAPGADWSIATGDGAVVVEVPETFGAELDATSGDGRVRVDGLPFTPTGSQGPRNVLSGRLGTGGPNIRIRSGDGAITVRKAT